MTFKTTIKLAPIVKKYIETKNAGTQREYTNRLWLLQLYSEETYGTIDKALNLIEKKKLNVYDFLVDFKNFHFNKKVSVGVKKGRVNTAVIFIEWAKKSVEIGRDKLKNLCAYGNAKTIDKFALDRSLVIKFLQTCTNPRLKAYLHLLAAIGCRPKQEALGLRIKDIIFNDNNCINNGDFQPYIHFPAEITKTDTERNIYMTKELQQALKQWIDYNYRERSRIDFINGKYVTSMYSPEKNPDNLLFRIYATKEEKKNKVDGVYFEIKEEFYKLLKTLGLDSRRDDARHDILLKSFRDFVRSEIGHEAKDPDYAELHIGHKQSTYVTRSKADRIKAFRRVEPYITYLNVDTIAKQAADFKSQSDKQAEEILQLKQEHEKMEKMLLEKNRQMEENFKKEIDKLQEALMPQWLESAKKTDPELRETPEAEVKIKPKINIVKKAKAR